MGTGSWVCDYEAELAKKLKIEDPDHFQNLVKMHLSFALDINMDEFDESVEKRFWVSKLGFAFHKKDKYSKDFLKNTDVNGTVLTEHAISQMYSLIEYLNKIENVCEEGIFRISGALSRQKKLKRCLQNGITINFEEKLYTVHDCASVLKTFLADLSEPLITDAYYPMCCQISELCKCEDGINTKLRNSLQLLLLLIPIENFCMLKYILQLLHLIANHAEKNKMSAENLATLFTPHLLCPRKLTGEALHTNTQMLWGVAVFMIQSGPDVFKIPTGLAADVKLYWAQKEKRKLSVKNNVSDESIADSCVVNTVFSFVDREKTAQENISNPTETALAQLYAHIQSLPESNKKRRLVKQFNKENGYGTPKKRSANIDKSQIKKRNLGDSLKKHIFNKSGRQDGGKLSKCDSGEKELPNSNLESKSKCHTLKLFEKSLDCRDCGCSDASEEYSKHLSCRNESVENVLSVRVDSIDENLNIKSKTPTMPIPLIRDTLLAGASFIIQNRNSVHNQKDSVPTEEHKLSENENVTPTCISNKDTNAVPENFPYFQNFYTPSTPINIKRHKRTSVSLKHSNNNNTHFCSTLTSTPAPYLINEYPITPTFCPPSDDMSPITMSAQKMSKAMQETMMTPRSRNPVIITSGSNTSQTNQTKCKNQNNSGLIHPPEANESSSHSEEFKTCIRSWKNDTSNISCDQEVLSKTFQDYLFSRSMLTASPVDSSFSSRTGDFDPSSLSGSEKLSDSLLFCLDGNVPVVENHLLSDEVFCNGKESTEDTDNHQSKHIRETVL